MTDERAPKPTSGSVPRPMGRFPTEGRQNATKTYVSASLNTRQTPEMFGGVSTD